MRKPWYKIIFSIAIIIAAIPSIVTDIREGFSGNYTHYGTLLVGISYFIESLFWVMEMWIEDINRIISESLDGFDGYKAKENKWEDDPDWVEFLEHEDKKGPWDEEWDKTNTVGGMTNTKESGFKKFQKKIDKKK
tara:strand:+ start:62 stop:466 length:405 start_codon:yes stop_codon:yes gene_type:complete